MDSITRTISHFAFKITHRVILLTRFCKLLTIVAILYGGGARASSASMARHLCLRVVSITSGRVRMYYMIIMLKFMEPEAEIEMVNRYTKYNAR